MPVPIQFTPQQRSRLLEIGVLGSQIDALERTLPICRSALRKLPPLTEVRDKLKNLASKMDSARSAMSTFLGGRSPSAEEALSRATMADFEAEGDGHTVENALHALARAIRILRQAKDSLQTRQRRHMSASFFPVERIARALLNGFIKHHMPRPLPPYELRPSRTAAPFPEIVSICYETIGHLNAKEGDRADPARAIRNYLTFLVKRNRAERVKVEKLMSRGQQPS
jgi:hypothetical protein